MAQVVNEGGAQARILDAGGRLAGQAVQLLHAQRLGVLDGAVDAGAEFLDPVRVAGDAALAGVPVAGRQVVQDQLKTVVVEAAADL